MGPKDPIFRYLVCRLIYLGEYLIVWYLDPWGNVGSMFASRSCQPDV